MERIGGERLVEKVINDINQVSQEVLVVTSKEQLSTICSLDLQAKIVVDIYPGKAAFGGIYTGLAAASSNYGLVVACDMPFLNICLLDYLVRNSSGFDVVIPRVEGKIEPLHAVYSKNCLKQIDHLLEKNILQMLQLLDIVKTKYITDNEVNLFDPEHLSFFNINTLKDFNEANRINSKFDKKVNTHNQGNP